MNNPIQEGVNRLLNNGKAIIGGGLTGLLAGYTNPDYTIISMDGGLGHVTQEMGLYLPIFLWKGDLTGKLLYELGLPTQTKVIEIGILDGCGVYNKGDRAEIEFTEYKQKSRLFHNPGKCMSEGKEALEIYQLPYMAVMDALSEKVMLPGRVIPGRVEWITDDEMGVQIEGTVWTFPWKSIINTIPLTSVMRILNNSSASFPLSNYRWTAKNYVRMVGSQDPRLAMLLPELRRYKLVYVVDPKLPFTRITPDPTALDAVTLEYVGSFGPGLVQPVGQILSGDPVHEIKLGPTGDKTIQNVGRYAQWVYNMKVEATLRRLHDVKQKVGEE